MEQIRPLEYTIKIYGEGFTEWFYFDGLRTNNRFRFSMVPEVPKNSRSSYKQNLKLIDKELKKKPQERADALFLVIDTDTLVNNKEHTTSIWRLKRNTKSRESSLSKAIPASNFGSCTIWPTVLPAPIMKPTKHCVRL